MPANHHIDTDAQLLITTWEGTATDNQFIEAIKNYQEKIQSKPEHHSFNEYINLCKVTEVDLTTKGLRTITEIASSTDEDAVKKKLALVVNSTLIYGIAKLYEAYRTIANSAGKEIHVFNNEKDALEWLKK